MPESSGSDPEDEAQHGRGKRARTLAAVDTILSEPFVTGPGPQAIDAIMTLLTELVTPHEQAATWKRLHGLVMTSRPEVVR
eukprot:g45270.t1